MVEVASDMRQSTIWSIKGLSTRGPVWTRDNAFILVWKTMGFTQELEKKGTSAVIGRFQTIFHDIGGGLEAVNKFS